MNQIAINTLTPAGSLTVFKTAKGLRWLAFSSNGYEDRDKEIVSTKALMADVERTAKDGQFGPLRWWHCGAPNPTSPDEPWGPGVDLGWCDWAGMSGPFLVESGTFIDDRIGEAIAQKAPGLALSLGFFHPKSEPDADGVFDHIRRFERSLAPAGKVANTLTAFYVPGATPVNAEQLTQLKALLGGTVPESELKALIDKHTGQATKTAEAAGLRFKTAGQPVYMLPDGSPAVIVDGALVALKALPAKADEEAEGEPPMPTEAEDALPEEDEEGETYAGDMSIKEFGDMITAAVTKAMTGMGSELKALNTRLNMAEKMGAIMEEMKGFMTGTAQKDASRAQQIESLETTIKSLQTQLSDLLGSAPADAAPASTSAITAAPVTAPDAFTVKTPSDRPAHSNPADSIGAWLEGPMG